MMGTLEMAPATWGRRPLWSMFYRRKDIGHPDEPLLSVFREHGVVARGEHVNHNQAAENRNIYQLVDDGWFVVNRMKAWQGSVGISFMRGIVSGHYICFEPTHQESPQFLNWLLRSDPYRHLFETLSRGVRPGQAEIDNDDLDQVKVLLPPIEDQRRIADFLDDQVARIDSIVAAREKQITLTGSWTQAQKDDLIMGGDQPGPFTPTAYAPFGRVPSRWRETKLRSTSAEIQTGPFGSQLHSDEYIRDGWPVVNPAGLKDSAIVRVAGMSVSDSVRERLARHILRQGDVVFGRRGDIGRAGLVGEAQDGWVLGTGSLRVRLGVAAPLIPSYLMLLLESSPLRFFFTAMSVGSTMMNLNSAILASVPVVLPTRAEQAEIVVRADLAHERSKESIGLLSQSIDRLDQLKRSMITAAVTGEFDVSTADGSQVPV